MALSPPDDTHRHNGGSVKGFLSFAAILAWLFGAMLLLRPAGFYAPTGILMTPLIATLAQAHEVTLVGLGVINWLARNATGTGLRAVLTGNLVIQGLSLWGVFGTMSLRPGLRVAPGALIHIVLGGFFAYFLSRSSREPTASSPPTGH
jgi:hypothetical protein